MYEMSIKYVIAYIVSGCAGSFMMLAISSKIKIRFLAFLGRNSLIIFGTHYIVRNIIRYNSNYSWPADWIVFFKYLAVVVIVSAVCLLLYPKLFPHLIGKKLIWNHERVH